ncbi:MAG TPA: hypothetical protein PKB11_12245 [Desulfovibrio sp.]|uniref:plasmid mobilization protein n=1 Tax=Desulfovibrio sp. TaxID=885 RepID=UPI002C1B3FBE|nr:hypothetical protein [Desulfovibrio sp.]HMM39519.1 hypothetical protein [Desulfovibrio sp.]
MAAKDYAEAAFRAEACGLPLSAWLREAALGRRLPRARPVVNQEVWGMLGKMMSGIALLKEHAGTKSEVFDMLLNYVSTIREKLAQ